MQMEPTLYSLSTNEKREEGGLTHKRAAKKNRCGSNTRTNESGRDLNNKKIKEEEYGQTFKEKRGRWAKTPR